MIKCEVTDKYTKLTAVGDIPTLGADLTHIFHGLLSEMPEKVKHEFMLSFIMAFDSGMIFDTDANGMKKLYDDLWEKLGIDDNDEDEKAEEDEKTATIDHLLDKLIELRSEIQKIREMTGTEEAKDETK